MSFYRVSLHTGKRLARPECALPGLARILRALLGYNVSLARQKDRAKNSLLLQARRSDRYLMGPDYAIKASLQDLLVISWHSYQGLVFHYV